MSADKSLQRSLRPTSAPPTPEQERFHYLIGQIEKARKDQTAWDALMLRFRQERTSKIGPLQTKLAAASRETVVAIDRLLDQRGWSRLERSSLQDLLCGTAEILLEAGADPELQALFDKHSRVSFADLKQDDLQRLKEEAEAFTGIDLGDEDLRTEEDLVQRMYEEMAAREAAEDTRRTDRAQRRRKSAAEQRGEENTQLARHSLREIYRKLASALHPDREPDPALRERKNALMQKINRAYATNDLLTLFETQLEIEQIDASHIRQFSAQRMKQYNKLLAEQLTGLKRELNESKYAFCSDYGVDMRSLSPQKLTSLVLQQARRLRAEVTRQNQFLLVLAEKASTKRWLKQQRRFAEGLFEDDDEM